MQSIKSKNQTIGRTALFLALTQTREEEEILKKQFIEEGFACAVTGTGGWADEITEKINNAVIGASLNNGIIQKKPEEVHAVMHAAFDAKSGMLIGAPTGANLAIKIAIVRAEGWLAVAIYGYSAMHVLTNHERAGLGIMHI